MKFLKYNFLVVLALLCPLLLHAIPLRFTSYKVKHGFFYGETKEYLYFKEKMLSRLDWEEHFVPYISFAGQVNIQNFYFAVNLLNTIPGRSGLMRDYDWVNTNESYVTAYSEHEAYFDKHIEIYPSIGYDFRVEKCRISPSVGILYRNREWSARNGFTQYPPSSIDPWTPNVPKKPLKGHIVTYEETTWYPLAALRFGYPINDRFTVELGGRFAPYLVVRTIDSHYLKGNRYHDAMQGGVGGGITGSVLYHPVGTDKLSFLADFGWKCLYTKKGTTASGSIGESDGLTLELAYRSKVESSLFWFSLGVVFYPAKLWSRE